MNGENHELSGDCHPGPPSQCARNCYDFRERNSDAQLAVSRASARCYRATALGWKAVGFTSEISRKVGFTARIADNGSRCSTDGKENHSIGAARAYSFPYEEHLAPANKL